MIRTTKKILLGTFLSATFLASPLFAQTANTDAAFLNRANAETTQGEWNRVNPNVRPGLFGFLRQNNRRSIDRPADVATPTAPNAASQNALQLKSGAETPDVLTGATETLKKHRVEAALIAIDDNPIMGNLTGCVNDLEATYEWLNQDADVPAESIQTARNKEATAERIRAILADLKNRECDRIVVFFSCHGITDGRNSYICPYDARRNEEDRFDFSPDDAERAENVAQYRLVPVYEILSTLKDSKAKEVLLVLDACRLVTTNEALENQDDVEFSFMSEFKEMFKEFEAEFRQNNETQKTAFSVVTSCSLNQGANETRLQGKDRGIFNYYFLEGVRGEADRYWCYDGGIQLSEAYNYAYEKTVAASLALNNDNGKQMPELFSVAERDMILSVYSLPQPNDTQNDLEFVVHAAGILAMSRVEEKANKIGLEALDFALLNIPNYTKALAIRGNVNRKLLNHKAALRDFSSIDQKFRMFGPKEGENNEKRFATLLDAPNAEANELSVVVDSDDVVTITDIKNDYCYVTEVNSEPLENPGWLHKESTYWNVGKASGFVPESPLQEARRQQQTSRPLSNSNGNQGGNYGAPVNFGGGMTPI